MKDYPVPVIMYHSIGFINKKWPWSYLTCPYKIFESQLKWLKMRKFHTITLTDLYNYMKSHIKLPENPIVLTFDDGYLDNWTYAYPLLKKYGFKGTIFVCPEFIDLREERRPNLEDVWSGKKGISQLNNSGFLSWEEMKVMEDEGVIDIQSHALTHTWYFKNNKIIDFRHPGDKYIWMTWNKYPHKKPFLQLDNEDLIDYGLPVYEHGKSLEVRRYFPDQKLDETVVHYVKNNRGRSFFKKGWRSKLFEIVERYKKNNEINDRYETRREYENRVRNELQKSKEIIEKYLDKKVKFLAWPGGGVNEVALRIASEVGYVSSTYGSEEIKDRVLFNVPNENPMRIRRTGTILFWDDKKNGHPQAFYQRGFLFVIFLYYFQNKKFIGSISRILFAGINKLYKLRFSI